MLEFLFASPNWGSTFRHLLEVIHWLSVSTSHNPTSNDPKYPLMLRFLLVRAEKCLSALHDEGQNHCSCQFWNPCRCLVSAERTPDLCLFHFLLLISAPSVPVWEKDFKYQEYHPVSDTSTSCPQVLWPPYRNHASMLLGSLSPGEIYIFVTWAENGW